MSLSCEVTEAFSPGPKVQLKLFSNAVFPDDTIDVLMSLHNSSECVSCDYHNMNFRILNYNTRTFNYNSTAVISSAMGMCSMVNCNTRTLNYSRTAVSSSAMHGYL